MRVCETAVIIGPVIRQIQLLSQTLYKVFKVKVSIQCKRLQLRTVNQILDQTWSIWIDQAIKTLRLLTIKDWNPNCHNSLLQWSPNYHNSLLRKHRRTRQILSGNDRPNKLQKVKNSNRFSKGEFHNLSPFQLLITVLKLDIIKTWQAPYLITWAFMRLIIPKSNLTRK